MTSALVRGRCVVEPELRRCGTRVREKEARVIELRLRQCDPQRLRECHQSSAEHRVLRHHRRQGSYRPPRSVTRRDERRKGQSLNTLCALTAKNRGGCARTHTWFMCLFVSCCTVTREAH